MKTSSRDVATRQLTLRLPRGLYQRAQRLAKERRTSVNALMRELLERLDREEREQELRRAYAIVGADADVEWAFEAQAEVARRG